MAGDWIKMESATPDKPEVWEMAEALEIDPDAVVGKLFRVWRWFDEHTEDGNAPIVTKSLLDRSVGVTGFCDAMIEAGWMEPNGTMVMLPNFDRHNGKTAKNRALTAKRVSKHKEKSNDNGNCEVTQTSLPREEKRREEYTEGTNVPLSEPSVPPCPHKEIIDLYNRILPELQQVIPERWGGAREKSLQARWRESEKHQSLDFWERFFTRLRDYPFYLGDNDRQWRADLGWVLKRNNFDKLVEKFVTDANRRK